MGVDCGMFCVAVNGTTSKIVREREREREREVISLASVWSVRQVCGLSWYTLLCAALEAEFTQEVMIGPLMRRWHSLSVSSGHCCLLAFAVHFASGRDT